VTAALRSACAIVGLPLLDHVIVTESGWWSFREAEGWEE
jgi:DNA repair protein RadC